MTVGIIQAHADAVLALLAAAPPAPPFEPLQIYDGEVPDRLPDGTGGPAVLYCLVYMTMTTPQGSSLTNESDTAVVNIYCHSVSGNATADGSAASARIVSQRVRGAVLDVVPTIADRSAFPIRHVDSPPVRRDETAGPRVYDQVDVYRLETVPATA